MANLSSQKIAQWAIESLSSEDWTLLPDICAEGIKRQNQFSDTEIEESLERELNYVADILRNRAAYAEENGEMVIYEIDDEDPPYIRKRHETYPEILKVVQEMNAVKFEVLCAEILKALGWSAAERSGGNDDDGVDFHAFDFPNNQLFSLPIPPSCKVLVIGQAKRYKQGNNVSETEIRKFVGGALKKLNDFRKSGRVAVLTPVIFAFWTSADFDEPAKNYAKIMGIWFMNGRTLVEYLRKLNLEEIIE